MQGRRARLAPRSIRGRLLLIVISAVVTTAALVTVVCAQVIAGFLADRQEQRVADIAGQIAGVAERSPDRTVDATSLRNFLPAGARVLLQPRDGEPPVSFGSDTLDPDAIAPQVTDLPDGRLRQITVGGQGGAVLTLAVVRVDTDGLRIRLEGLDQPVETDSVVFATDITEDRTTLTRLTWLGAGVGGLTIVAVGIVSALVIRLGIRPLTAMAATADSITSGDRTRRLPVDGAGVETDHLAVSINRALDAQQVAEDRLRTFLADVSHELRTPLTSVNGWIDLYLQGGLQDAAQRDRAMERVESEVARMRTLVDELTLLSRLDAHRPLDAAPIDLAELAREVVDDARVVADDRDIALDADEVVVRGDTARLAQVLRNLVGNAVQHTPTATAVRVEVAREGGEAVLRVHDAGPGISASDVPHVFERFWRAEPSRSRATGGSGLGLAIVASIVEAHGGAVRVTSSPDRGTTFTVSLPALPADSSGVSIWAAAPRSSYSTNEVLSPRVNPPVE